MRSFAHFLFAFLLKIANFKEQLWAKYSGHSLQKSDCQQFAHVTLYTRATMSNLLTLLFTKEQGEQIALVSC